MSAREGVLIVGAGLAGLMLALKLSPRRVRVISPAPLGQASASAWAQGGLAAALAQEDSAALHAEDTIRAGAGLVDPVVALLIAEQGPARVHDLIALGVAFDRGADGALALSLEAAHSRPRIARVSGDLAGRAIMEALIAAARSAAHIEIVEGLSAAALIHDCNGAVRGISCIAIDKGDIVDLVADEVVLATGGVGGLYAITTNPAGARGMGLALAARAGALIADPEFVQFHPTAIDVGRDPAPLATEALRGAGALLVNAKGEHFVSELEAGRGAFLDAREAVGARFPNAFPTVFGACMEAGIDPRTALIPVAPAAHYHMGGIVSDLWGRASLDGLSVVGECASTGAHGANRLASNSLLEAVVFAHRIAERLREAPAATALALAPPAPHLAPLEPALSAKWRGLMQKHAGVVRDAAGLSAALQELTRDEAMVGEANAFTVMRLILAAALARTESRGGHYRSDYPDAAEPRRSFIHGTTHSSAA
jgi:L-aspartate oxidase